LSKEPEVEVQFTIAHAQTCATFFHVALSNFSSKSVDVWDSLVTYGVFAGFLSGAGADSFSMLIFGNLGSLTFNTYRTRAITPINIKTIKI
jgi:hypothetical protein